MYDTPFEQPISERLDLDTFQPHEIEFLIADYLAECRKRGIIEVHLHHSRDTVGDRLVAIREQLEHLPGIVEYRLGQRGGDGWWYETLVVLEPV
jgi:hypothetical protein